MSRDELDRISGSPYCDPQCCLQCMRNTCCAGRSKAPTREERTAAITKMLDELAAEGLLKKNDDGTYEPTEEGRLVIELESQLEKQ